MYEFRSLKSRSTDTLPASLVVSCQICVDSNASFTLGTGHFTTAIDAMRYLLPCSCGNNVTIDPSQAGMAVSCQCGKSLEVPTLREIRQLEPAEDSGPARAMPTKDKKAGWSAWRGAIFSVGVTILLLSLCAVVWAAYARTPYLEMQSPPSLAEVPVDESLLLWQDFRDNGLVGARPWPYVEARRIASELTQLMYVAGGVAIVSLIAVVGSIVGQRSKPGT